MQAPSASSRHTARMPKQACSISGALASCARRGVGRGGLVSFALTALLLPRAWGQDTAASYEEALKRVQQYQGKLVRFRPSIRWLAEGGGLLWSEESEGPAGAGGSSRARRAATRTPSPS